MEFMRNLLGIGLEPKDFTIVNVCLRGLIVFVCAIVIVRVGHKRFMSRMTAFDAVLGFILASVLSRAINGSAQILPTLAVSLLLVLMHRLLSAFSFYSEGFGSVIKGHDDVLVRDGVEDRKLMERHKISKTDILEEARLNGKIDGLKEIHLAVLERSGMISVIPSEKK